eukprot:scaffold1194_cov369-Prasinococcus_capsulatus_cf.AAC.17
MPVAQTLQPFVFPHRRRRLCTRVRAALPAKTVMWPYSVVPKAMELAGAICEGGRAPADQQRKAGCMDVILTWLSSFAVAGVMTSVPSMGTH